MWTLNVKKNKLDIRNAIRMMTHYPIDLFTFITSLAYNSPSNKYPFSRFTLIAPPLIAFGSGIT